MAEVWTWLEGTELAYQIGATWWFPLLESLHVVGLALLLGSILMLDLRLLGWTARGNLPAQMSAGMMGWVWLGFGIALVSGMGMFISRPSAYAANTAFQIKFVLLMVLGGNLALYRLTRLSTARIAATVSLVAWAGVVLAGRWTGHIN